MLGADKSGDDAAEYLGCFHLGYGRFLTVTRTTFARAALLPQMQTSYCNWWDAEEPRNSSGEWREKDKKRLNTEDTEEEAQRTQRRVEEFKVEGSEGSGFLVKTGTQKRKKPSPYSAFSKTLVSEEAGKA